MRIFLFILFFTFTAVAAVGQTDTSDTFDMYDTGDAAPVVKPIKPVKKRPAADTTLKATVEGTDSALNAVTIIPQDTVKPAAPAPVITAKPRQLKPIDSFYLRILDNPFLRTTAKPVYLVINERQRVDKDEIFYLLSGIMLLLAFIKLVFSRYFANVFRLFLQPTFRQKQTREQLLQNSFPSFLLNFFFIVSAGAYVTFLLHYYNLVSLNFWLTMVYSTAALLVLYTGKFIVLSFAGWVFNVKEAADTYIFIVYLINKILGVVLVPCTIILAFSKPEVASVSVSVSLMIILLLFLYRYLVSFAPVSREVKVSPLHFFLYVFAFEITPLLLIYKTLSIYLIKSA